MWHVYRHVSAFEGAHYVCMHVRRQAGTMCHPISLPISLFELRPLTEPGSPQPTKLVGPQVPRHQCWAKDKLPCGLMM